MQTIPNTNGAREQKDARQDKAVAPLAKLAYMTPPIDVLEGDDEVLVVADVPGIRAQDVDIHFDKDVLTLIGKRESLGIAYKRTFAISRDVDAERINAELSDGVLTLHLPKLASRRARSIHVKTT
jgi:HSP20 family protein